MKRRKKHSLFTLGDYINSYIINNSMCPISLMRFVVSNESVVYQKHAVHNYNQYLIIKLIFLLNQFYPGRILIFEF